jgi:hypothetical protein
MSDDHAIVQMLSNAVHKITNLEGKLALANARIAKLESLLDDAHKQIDILQNNNKPGTR